MNERQTTRTRTQDPTHIQYHASSHHNRNLPLSLGGVKNVMKPVLCASRVLSSSPGCLSFVRCVDFEFPPFSRMWAAYIELAGIVPLGSSQGQDSRESCDNSRTNWGSLERRGEGNPKFGALTITLESSGRDRIDEGDTGRHTRD